MSDAVENLKKKTLEKAYKKDSKGHPKLEEEAALLRGMAEMLEEFKPFPKDKVNRQIDKKEKSDDIQDKADAHTMKSVKNYRTRMTDRDKAQQKFRGSDKEKTIAQHQKHYDTQVNQNAKSNKNDQKAADLRSKGKNKKADKVQTKANNQAHKANRAGIRRSGMDAVGMSWGRATEADDNKQAEVNKKDKADRASAKSGLDRTNLESAYNKPADSLPGMATGKTAEKRAPYNIKGPKIKNTIKKESMNFTEFLDSAVHPLYEKEGEVPKCPPGYRYDAKLVMCVPKTKKDSIGNEQKTSDKDLKPGSGSSYNVWGNTGYDGSGYAWEEQPTSNDKAGY